MSTRKSERAFRRSYRRAVVKYTAFAVLNWFGLAAYAISVIGPAVQSIRHIVLTRGTRALLLYLFPLVWSSFASIAVLRTVKYCAAMLAFLREKVSVKSGTVTQKQGRRYVVEGIPPEGVKRVSIAYFIRPICFQIHDRDCEPEGGLQPGDLVSVVYPADRILYHDTHGSKSIPAIFTFSQTRIDRRALFPKSDPRLRLVLWCVCVFCLTAALSGGFYCVWNRIWTAMLASHGVTL